MAESAIRFDREFDLALTRINQMSAGINTTLSTLHWGAGREEVRVRERLVEQLADYTAAVRELGGVSD